MKIIWDGICVLQHFEKHETKPELAFTFNGNIAKYEKAAIYSSCLASVSLFEMCLPTCVIRVFESV